MSTSVMGFVRPLSYVAAIALGVGVGLSGARLASSAPPHTAQSQLAPPTSATTTPPTVISPAPFDPAPDRLRATEIEKRLAALEKQATPSPSAPSVGAPVSPEESRDIHAAAQTAMLDRFRSEGIDPSWGPAATRSLASDLGKGAAEHAGAVVKDVKCATTVCVANLEWPTYTAAKAGYAGLVHHQFGLNCARSVFVPHPDDPTRAYEASLILDCESARAN